MGLKSWDWRVVTKGLGLNVCDWRDRHVATERLQINAWDWKGRIATEGLTLNGCHWRVATADRLQLKGCSKRLWSEVLGQKFCKTSNCFWLKGWNWVVVNKWLQQTGCNWSVANEDLGRRAWSWGVVTEGFQLKACGWMVGTEGTSKRQLKFCNWTFGTAGEGSGLKGYN